MLAAGRLEGRRRTLAAVAAIVPLTALMLLAGRVPDELLLPGGWDPLAGGISRGISDLPGVRVPYRGLDDWVRTVLPLGASALVLVAALLAFWPRRKGRLGFPALALLAADRALRRPGRRARLHRRVPPRRRLHAADGRLPAAREAAPARQPGGGGARGRRHARRARRRARPQPRPAVVRLRDVGAPDVVLEVDDVHLEPQLRRTQLAARRPRAAARARAPGRVLEGREPRHLRRRAVGALAARLRGARAARGSGSRRHLDADDPGLDPQPAHGSVHHRGLRERRRHPQTQRHADARRAVRRPAHAPARRHVHGACVHAEAAREPAPPRGD